MGTYVVSYINFYDNDLLSTVVMSVNETDALLKGIWALQNQALTTQLASWEEDEFLVDLKGKAVEDIKNACFDCDMAVNVIKIA
jgi:hypothetical protein